MPLDGGRAQHLQSPGTQATKEYGRSDNQDRHKGRGFMDEAPEQAQVEE